MSGSSLRACRVSAKELVLGVPLLGVPLLVSNTRDKRSIECGAGQHRGTRDVCVCMCTCVCVSEFVFVHVCVRARI